MLHKKNCIDKQCVHETNWLHNINLSYLSVFSSSFVSLFSLSVSENIAARRYTFIKKKKLYYKLRKKSWKKWLKVVFICNWSFSVKDKTKIKLWTYASHMRQLWPCYIITCNRIKIELNENLIFLSEFFLFAFIWYFSIVFWQGNLKWKRKIPQLQISKNMLNALFLLYEDH